MYINPKKSVAFVYSNDKQAEKEIREMTPFKIITNNIKYLSVTTKQVKEQYNKIVKFLMKEIEEDLRRWKDLLCLWIGRINIIKDGHLAKSNLNIQRNSHQISTQFFIQLERAILTLFGITKTQD